MVLGQSFELIFHMFTNQIMFLAAKTFILKSLPSFHHSNTGTIISYKSIKHDPIRTIHYRMKLLVRCKRS